MRVLSAIQPTGSIHLGNYLGALRHWVTLQDRNECFFEIADLHSLTTGLAPNERAANTLGTAAILLAIGIEPSRATLFVQSQVHQHAELAWILNCFTHLGELRRMTQFKAKAQARHANPTVGLFVYPVLQAADILLYHAESIPVGEDQIQHLELARDLAERFNRKFGKTFTVPKAFVARTGARIMNLQDPRTKMSKSAGPPQGVIQLTDTPDGIQRKIRGAVTDSGSEVISSSEKPALTNLLSIYSAMANQDVRDVERSFAGTGYAKFKQALADLVVGTLRPIHERYAFWTANSRDLSLELEKGASHAESTASATLREVDERVGLLSFRKEN